jgi:replicative superfamily II helicase
MVSITSEQFELVADWDLSGSFERNAIRDGGWALRSASGVVLEEWMNESHEDYLFEKYDVSPGELNSKLDRADWLVYSCIEICKILNLKDLI